MKSKWLAAAAATALALFATLSTPAQDPEAGPVQDSDQLQKVAPAPAVPAPRATPEPPASLGVFDGEVWRERLTEPDLARREVHFDRLVREAAVDPVLQSWVRETAAGAAQPELAWTCRLALREIESLSVRSNPFGGFGFPGRGPATDFDQLQRQLEEMLQGFGQPWDPFGDWDRQGVAPVPPMPQVPGGTGGSSSQRSVRIEQDGDGARVIITEIVDGEEQTQEYEGATLEDILAAHPELEEEIGIAPGAMRLQLGPGLQGLQKRAFGIPANPLVFGVYVSQASEPRRGQLGLEPDVGLLVRGTEPGTYAHYLGITLGDVLVELNGETLRGLEDISGIMAERLPEDPLEVLWYDNWGRRHRETWVPPGDGDR